MITCNGGYTKGDFTCEKMYTSEGNVSNVNYSIQMDIGHQYCNACCKYCLCHPIPAKENLYSHFKKDFPKMIELIKSTDSMRGYKNNPVHRFEIWGGEPLLNFEAFKETFDVLNEAFPGSMFSTSTNGLILSKDEVCDYLIENHFHLQLSHDGLGQKLRTGNVEPLEGKSGENIKALVQLGVLDCINCTLSTVNPSWYENIEFWNKYFKDWGKEVYTKLNHPYDSDYDFPFAFTDEILDKYLQEFVSLYWFCFYNKSAFPSFRGYILEQGNRWREVQDEDPVGACRSFQAYKYNLPGHKQPWNFVITTTGDYGECNLSEKVDNPGGIQPDYCSDCKYKNQAECKHCGAMKFPKQPYYCKKWMETLERIHELKKIGVNYGSKCTRPRGLI